MRSFCDKGFRLFAAAGIKASHPPLLSEAYDAQAFARWEKTQNYRKTFDKCIVSMAQAQISDLLWEDSTALAASQLSSKSTYDLLGPSLLESTQNFSRLQHSVVAPELTGTADEETKKILEDLYKALPTLLKRNSGSGLVHCAALCHLFAEKAFLPQPQALVSEHDDQYKLILIDPHPLSDPTRLVAKQLNEVSTHREKARLLYELCLRADDDVQVEKWALSQEADLSTHAKDFLEKHHSEEFYDETFLADIAHTVLPTMEVPPPTFMSRAKFYSGQVTKILEYLPQPSLV